MATRIFSTKNKAELLHDNKVYQFRGVDCFYNAAKLASELNNPKRVASLMDYIERLYESKVESINSIPFNHYIKELRNNNGNL